LQLLVVIIYFPERLIGVPENRTEVVLAVRVVVGGEGGEMSKRSDQAEDIGILYRVKTIEIHNTQIKDISRQIAMYFASSRVKRLRFDHGSTVQLKRRDSEDYFSIDISHLNDIIDINDDEQYALVEPNVPFDRLVSQTLEAGLVPLVVPELPGITCGGAVIGGAGEISSYKVGLFDDNCLEYEIVLGNGKVITASDTYYSDIFYSLPWSYGTLGLLSLIKLKLVPARPYVHLRYCPFETYDDAIACMKRVSHKEEHTFIDGIVYSKTKTVVMLGNFSDKTSCPIQTFSSPHDPWFYEHAREVTKTTAHYEELIPITDYLFRYNRNGFWMGKVFFEFLHIPYTMLTRKLFSPYLNARAMFDAVQKLNLTRSFFIHDYVTDFDAAADLISYADTIVGIYPIWLCPIRTFHAKEKISPTNVSREDIVLDIGVYGRSKKYTTDKQGTNNKIERYATAHKSMKVLYSEVFYPEDEFWTIYDKAVYDAIRSKYHAEDVFPDLWNKVRSKDTIDPTLSFGIPKLLLATIIGTSKNA
jgi:hypothetical protein